MKCNSLLRRPNVRAVFGGLGAVVVGELTLNFFPQLVLGFFARGAAQLASLFSGAPLLRVDEGWMLVGAGRPVVVSAACSGADYFLIVAALVSGRMASRGSQPVRAAAAGLFFALPLSLFINALRVVTVTQAHRWLAPLLPASCGAFLHLLTGVAVFLPALIALNFLLEFHGRSRFSLGR